MPESDAQKARPTTLKQTDSAQQIPPPRRVRPKLNYSTKYRHYLHPKYWNTWIALGAMYMLAKLPTGLNFAAGRFVGYLFFFFAARRRHITRTNIKLCFPELSDAEQRKLVKETIIDNGIGLAETCIAWFNHQRITHDMIEVEGADNLENATSQGRGVILVGAHYTTLDLGGVLMAKIQKVGVMYRAKKNPLFDLVMKNARSKFCEAVIERSDMRSVIRFIRKGGVMWYAPDQDYGRRNSVFAPFFGNTASTITVIPRLVKLNNSPVLILGHHRKADHSGYVVSITPPVTDFPSGNDEIDATTINSELEKQIRKYPAQYMWLHRRFKTRPPGEPKLYQKS